MGLGHNGTWTQWDWDTTGLGHMGFRHNRTGTHGTGTQQDWDTWDWDTMGVGHVSGSRYSKGWLGDSQ